MGQGTGRGRKGCPRLPFELLEGSEVNRSRTRKAKAPAEATRRNILMALFLPLLKVKGTYPKGQKGKVSRILGNNKCNSLSIKFA